MKEPYVKKLTYRLIPNEHADYTKTFPVIDETDDFTIKIDNYIATFTMKKRFKSKIEAISIAEKYVNRWRIIIGIKHGPNNLKFQIQNIEIVDNNSSKSADIRSIVAVTDSAEVDASYSSFPLPQKRFDVSFDVTAMYQSYKEYFEGNEKLTSMAYFCLTVLERSAGGRKEAAEKFLISFNLLRKLGTLSNRGDLKDTRKLKGDLIPLTDLEKTWMPDVIKRLILRAGEVASNPTEKLKQINMKDFLKL